MTNSVFYQLIGRLMHTSVLLTVTWLVDQLVWSADVYIRRIYDLRRSRRNHCQHGRTGDAPKVGCMGTLIDMRHYDDS